MKARTLIITTGAIAALVAGSVEPAGAKVASACAAARSQTGSVGYDGQGWTYPLTTIRKVVVVGNGTKAPYTLYVPHLMKPAAGCGRVTAGTSPAHTGAGS